MADLLGQDDIDAGCLLEAATYREAEADRAVQHAARRRVTREAAQKGPKT